jgi:hypothetical protein
MKKALILLFSIVMAMGATAQHSHHLEGRHGNEFHRPRYSIGIGGGYYSPFSPFYGLYGPYFGPYPYGDWYGSMPSKLDMEIGDIRNDYRDKIWSVRHDKSKSRQE